MKTFLKWFGIGLAILVIVLLILLAFETVLPQGTKVSTEVLITLSAAVLSLTFTYFPKLRVSFAALPSEQKQTVNLGLIILLAGGMFLLTCGGISALPGVICTKEGVIQMLMYVFLAGGGNQLTYLISPQPTDVKQAKTARHTEQG